MTCSPCRTRSRSRGSFRVCCIVDSQRARSYAPCQEEAPTPLDLPLQPGVTSENARKAEQVVALGRFLLIKAQKNSGREPRKARAMLSGSHCKQVPWEIAMEPDKRQAIDGFVMGGAPRPFRLET